MSLLLCLVFFVSGASALVFETLWFRQAGLALGNSVWASTLVLSSFMGGLALGSGLAGRVGGRIRRPVRAYAWLELAIAVTAPLLVAILPRLTDTLAPALGPLLDRPWLLNPLRFAISFALLLVPSAAMGATLPLLVGALARRDANFGRVLGRLYAWNTFGAVVGSLSGELVLIARFGILRSALLAAGLNALAALAALTLARAGMSDGAEESAPGRPPLGARARRLLAASFLSGAILLALEVVWFRFLQLFVPSTSLAFAVMLCVVLVGIAAGSLVASWWLRLAPSAHRCASGVALLAGAAALSLYAGFDTVIGSAFASAIEKGGVVYVHRPGNVLALGASLMGPTCFASGVLFALIGHAAREALAFPTRTAGLVTVSNTVGSALGSLLAGFVLLPTLGVERSLFALAAAYAVVALLVAGGPRLALLAAAAWLLALVSFPFGRMQAVHLRNPARPYLARGMQVAATHEGLTETLVYLRQSLFGEPLYHRLLTNGFSMAANATPGRRYMKLFVYWPVAVRPDPRRALLISYGMGSTARALVDTRSLETIDVVDISRDIVELSRMLFEPGASPLDDPRVTVHIEDGRFFLETTGRRYDLITGEPPPPVNAGVVSLYTREYFELLRARLAEGGVATYWLPVHMLAASDTRAILRAFCQAFADCSLWTGMGFDWMLAGTRGLGGPVSESGFGAQWRDPRVAPELRALGFERPEQIGALFLGDARDLAGWTRDTPPLADDFPQRLSNAPVVASHSSAFHAGLMDVAKTRRRFERSAWIRSHWPDALRRRSLDYFEVQGQINWLHGPGRGGDAEMDVADLHRLLTRTALRAPILWALATDEDAVRIAARAEPVADEAWLRARLLGIGALAERRYEEAADWFERGLEGAPGAPVLRMLRAFSLAMAERPEAAQAELRALAAGRPPSPTLRRYGAEMRRLFGLSDPFASPREQPGEAAAPGR